MNGIHCPLAENVVSMRRDQMTKVIDRIKILSTAPTLLKTCRHKNVPIVKRVILGYYRSGYNALVQTF